MPIVMIPKLENPAKTSAVKSFDAFKNKEGYQALAQGVGDAGDQLKEILVERQTLINNVVMEEFKEDDKKFREEYIAKKNAELAQKGLPPITGNLAEEMGETYKKDHAAYFSTRYGNRLNGGAQRTLLSAIDQAGAVGAVDVKYLARTVENSQILESIKAKVIPLLQQGKIEEAKKFMAPYVAKNILTQTYADQLVNDAPRMQQELAMGKDAETNPGGFLERSANWKKSPYALVDEKTGAQKRQKAQENVRARQMQLAKEMSAARAGIGRANPNVRALAQAGIISQAQADGIAKNDFEGLLSATQAATKAPLPFLTPAQQTRWDSGDMRVLAELKDGTQIMDYLIRADKDSPQYKAFEPQARILLAASGFSQGYAQSFLKEIVEKQKGNEEAVENDILFLQGLDAISERTLRDPAFTDRTQAAKAYQQATRNYLVDYRANRGKEDNQKMIDRALELAGVAQKKGKNKSEVQNNKTQ